jgi:hypothetical protein
VFEELAAGAKQDAEKLIRAVGRGFIPGKRVTESMRALAPEVCFSGNSPDVAPSSAAGKAQRFFGGIFGTTEVVP